VAKEDFQRLIASFRSLLGELDSRPFDLTWHSVVGHCRIAGGIFSGIGTVQEWIGHSKENPPFDLDRRIDVARLSMPLDEMCTEFTLGMEWVTLPRLDSLRAVREEFHALSRTAGTQLPSAIRQPLARFIYALNDDMAAWWYALLFFLNQEPASYEANGEILHHSEITIFQPVLLSTVAIENFGLNTEQPNWPNDILDASIRRTTPAHAPDFRSVRWDGALYTFSVAQARVVEMLWDCWRAGTPEVGSETLLEAVDREAPPQSVRGLFRDHPAWGTMIIAGSTKGSHRLAELAKKG